jgi:UPF0271 protein
MPGQARAYLCVQGGIDVPRVLASRSTLVRAGIGGHEGRVLRAGDVLRVGPVWIVGRIRGDVERSTCAARVLRSESPASEGRATSTIRVTPGPHADLFVRPAAALLEHVEFTIGAKSDRMGLRLEGVRLPVPTLAAGDGRLASEPMPGGAIQVPPDGRPIVLMVDGPTTGGYPVIATVASVDIAMLGQLAPGARVRFVCVSEERAREAWRRREAEINRAVPRAASVLINADVGEDASDAGIARDVALMQHLDLIHVACGGHAGDDRTMQTLVREAKSRGVHVGAHPSYPDRAGFGRIPMAMSPEALRTAIREQVSVLARIAAEEHVPIRTVKPHGALYHDCARAEVARAVASGASDALADAGDWCLVGACASPAIDHWRAAGCRTLEEAFADRAYASDGSLLARSIPGSVISDPDRCTAQVKALIEKRGPELGLAPGLSFASDTICVHSDTPNALAITRAVRTVTAESQRSSEPASQQTSE